MEHQRPRASNRAPERSGRFETMPIMNPIGNSSPLVGSATPQAAFAGAQPRRGYGAIIVTQCNIVGDKRSGTPLSASYTVVIFVGDRSIAGGKSVDRGGPTK